MIPKFINSYDELKNYLLKTTLEEKKELLKDPNIKKILINSPRKYNFIWLAQSDDPDIIPLLLKNGIEILKKTDDLKDKMNGILTSGQNYVDKLFEMEDFNELILDNQHNRRI